MEETKKKMRTDWKRIHLLHPTSSSSPEQELEDVTEKVREVYESVVATGRDAKLLLKQ